MTAAADLSLAQVRLALAADIAAGAAFDGWSMAAVADAADLAGVDRHVAALAFADGPMAMIAAWIAQIDAAEHLYEQVRTGKARNIKITEGQVIGTTLGARLGRPRGTETRPRGVAVLPDRRNRRPSRIT